MGARQTQEHQVPFAVVILMRAGYLARAAFYGLIAYFAIRAALTPLDVNGARAAFDAVFDGILG